MLMTVGEFKTRTAGAIDVLVEELADITGRYSAAELAAWRSSLPKIATAFASECFDDLHVFFRREGHLSLEYQLPAAFSWADMVLLGRHRNRPSAIVIELKDWATRGDKPGSVEGLVQRFGEPVLHPSDQVRGYTEYCRRFHSAIQDHQAAVYGCVVFTNDIHTSPYLSAPNDTLAESYPIFTLSREDVGQRLPDYFSTRLTSPDKDFAEQFERGHYVQDRGFVKQIGHQILSPGTSPFELVDNQRLAFAMIKARLEETILGIRGTLRKQVIIVDGPPGSGKSVIAAKIWAHLVSDDRLPDGSAVFTTTSASQNSNWGHLFRQTAHDAAAGGVVKKAASYTPITTQALGRLRRRHGTDFLVDASQWRQNLRTLRALGTPFQDGARDEQYLVSIVDEAHALINPEGPEGRGQFGFVVTLGPQAYQIIRASTVSIFLLDAKQSFRDRENTTVDQIKAWAKELGANVTDGISLTGAQFRCAGSKDYVDWVEAVLRGDPPEVVRPLARRWRDAMELRIVENPAELDRRLKARISEGRSARLLASYARKWKTKGAAAPHDLPPQMMDFHEPYQVDGKPHWWNRIWNYVPSNGLDYTYFVQARPGSRMHDDPLCEVGCPYAVRGFDFDYVGLLWLGDLRRRSGRWVAETNQVFESGIDRSLASAKRERDTTGSAHLRLVTVLAQGYRILLTRPLRGIYVWCEDLETRQYLQSCLGQFDRD